MAGIPGGAKSRRCARAASSGRSPPSPRPGKWFALSAGPAETGAWERGWATIPEGGGSAEGVWLGPLSPHRRRDGEEDPARPRPAGGAERVTERREGREEQQQQPEDGGRPPGNSLAGGKVDSVIGQCEGKPRRSLNRPSVWFLPGSLEVVCNINRKHDSRREC